MKKINFHFSTGNKNLLLNKFLDLLIVVFGVTIAFQLNNLKERSDQRSLEHFYIESILSDIDKDIESIGRILDELRSDSSLTSVCISKHIAGMTSYDTLSLAIVNVLSFETFNYRNDNTYTALMNSHGLSIIKSKDVRNLITEYYKCYKSIDRFEYVYTEFLLSDFHPYFKSYLDYATMKIEHTAFAKDVRTYNSMLIAQGQLNDGIGTYKNALFKASTLKKKLITKL